MVRAMKGDKMIIPMAKKRGAPKGNSNYNYPGELRATQFALEQAVKCIRALEKQQDGLAKLDKLKDITIQALTNRLKRLEDRVTRTDSE